MEKEIKIIPPKGYEIDKENSTFECIKFKPIVKKKWIDSNPEITGFCLCGSNVIDYPFPNSRWDESDKNVFATKKQAKSVLAMAPISQIMANDERFGGLITDEEWNNPQIEKYVLYRCKDAIVKSVNYTTYRFLAFRTADQRDLFLEENEDLIKGYLMINQYESK